MNGYLRRGSEMLRDWNELQMQVAGLIFACFASWVLYERSNRSGGSAIVRAWLRIQRTRPTNP